MTTKTGDFPEHDDWLVLHVSYGETDAMGVVYYAEYLHWFERGRGKLIRERGMSYRDVEARGVLLPVVEAGCRYRSPARYDDEIHLRTGIEDWGRASITFVYEVWKVEGEKRTLLVTGRTKHACVSPAGRPIACPDWLKTMLEGGAA